jgi:enamine deaminase RidA (YjgF/YER057c/UK114 family)
MTDKLEYLNPPGAPPAQGLYSHATRVKPGNLLFVAGQLSVADDGSVDGKHDFEAQFARVFKNLGDVLAALNCDFNDVVKFTTFLVHSQDIEKFMPLRAKLFPTLFKTSVYPPNTLLVVDRLVKEDFLIELEAIVRERD